MASTSQLPPDVNHGVRVNITIWTLVALSTITVGLRLWAKLRTAHRLYWDDSLMICSLATGLVYVIITTLQVQNGLGRHFLFLDPSQLVTEQHYAIVTFAWPVISTMLGRIAFSITLLYLTGTDRRVPKWPILLIIALQAAANTALIILFYAQCGTHLGLLWTISQTVGEEIAEKCIANTVKQDVAYFVGAVNCLTDLFCTVLPAVLIEHTKFSTKKKIALASLLCLSVVALVAAIIKTYFASSLTKVTDPTFDIVTFVIWVNVEINVVIICASIPLLRPLFAKPQKLVETVSFDQQSSYTAGSKFSKFSKDRFRVTALDHSTSSEEKIVPYDQDQYEMERPSGIRVIREVEVTYQPADASFVHAALVGLIQGEIANPKLAQK